MSEMMPGNLENQLAEEQAKNAHLRVELRILREFFKDQEKEILRSHGLLKEWSNMFGNHALGGPVQGKELMGRTQEALGNTPDPTDEV